MAQRRRVRSVHSSSARPGHRAVRLFVLGELGRSKVRSAARVWSAFQQQS
ncbi:hypothetical protein [Streptomyces chromofuscus]|uniref:Uncharacterized protein n=1 Tax=Streptomyces chromofuscus TaxID=42881 RepID=A0A7M2T7D5_STRCW|nr:hypothetical protein [Streptomyces chromofuscus]QOV44627.1 hypothetical protein IPT68_00850 [Streptomyces chromofuscus]